jgi:hypothetical protein
MRQLLSDLNEGIYVSGTGYTANYIDSYHRTNAMRNRNDPDDVEDGIINLIHTGFKPGSGDMYGKGLYSTGDWDSQFKDNGDMLGYGIGIIKYRTPTKNVLIFDYRVSKKVYGYGKHTLTNQLVNVFKIYPAGKVPDFIDALSNDLERTFKYPKLSADRAYSVWYEMWQKGDKFDQNKLQKFLTLGQGYPEAPEAIKSLYGKAFQSGDYKGTKVIFNKTNVIGIAFSGNHDGNVLFIKEDSLKLITPIMYCIMDINKPGDSKAFVKPWTPVKGGISAAGSIAGFSDMLKATGIPSGKNSFDTVLFDQLSTMGETASIKFIKDTFKWTWMGSRKFNQLDIAFKQNREDFIFGGTWQLGDCNVHYFGKPDDIIQELKQIDKNISFGNNQIPIFRAGTFLGDEFTGIMIGGVFQNGIFNGIFKGGLIDFDAKITWGAKAKIDIEKTLTRSIRYMKKVYDIGENDPEAFVANLKAGIVVKSSNGIRGVDDAKSLAEAVKNKLPFVSNKIIIDDSYHGSKTIPLGFAEVVKVYPWLFERNAHITWKVDPSIEIQKDRIIVLSGEIRTGDVFFDEWGKDTSVIGGNIFGNNIFSGVLNGGNYREGLFDGVYIKGNLFLDKFTWGKNADWDVKNLPVFKYNNITYPLEAFMLMLPDSTGKKPLYKSMQDIIDAIRDGSFTRNKRAYDKALRDFQIGKGPEPKLITGKSKYTKVAIDDLGISQDDIDNETSDWSGDDGSTMIASFDRSEVKWLNEHLKLSITQYLDKMISRIINEKIYQFDDLDAQEQEVLYNIFRDTYVKATGAAFDKDDFDWRASNWMFFGEPPNGTSNETAVGGIAVRKQVSNNMYKLVASFGNFRGVLKGFDELKQRANGASIWGIVDETIKRLIIKHDKDFVAPPGIVVKAMEAGIKKLSNGEVKSVSLDGSMQVDTPAGMMKKYFIANKDYIRWLLDSISDPSNASRLPVPQTVLVPLIGIIQKLL